ncbi:MAG TPA: NADH:flavin oxidoreductase/NADH oxidase [Casimicrobiaceae bacterium]|nr:NADH:flavin oxidoreductase/NADH oxidase [Casimicrobiaceae bacterium]
MALFDPLHLRGVRLANRIVVSPMCQYSAVDGCASDWHSIHWGQLLLSSAGMFTIEATAVNAQGRITPGDLGLYDDASERALGERLARARAQTPSMPVALQLAHAGRKASSNVPWAGGELLAPADGGWTPVAPSALAIKPGEPPPAALDIAGIDAVRAAFADTARRADRIGIDALEVHMAHGYLLHEFLSPLANARSDAYGGPFDHRVRLPLAVFDAVRAAWPERKPLGARLSCTDWVDGGWTLDESIELARRLVARGCDWIDCSSGGVSPAQKIPVAPGYQVPFARAIKRATDATTMAVGMITEPAQAEAIIAAQDADMVAMARAFLWEPRWPWHAAVALGGRVVAPPQYLRAVPREAQKAFGEIKAGRR